MSTLIGVCTWSLDRHDVVRGIKLAGGELGLPVAQIAFFTENAVRRADPDAIVRAAQDANVRLVGTFVGFEREDYSSIVRLAATGGYLPDEEYPTRLATTLEAGKLTAALGCRSLAVHVGTVPRESTSPPYTKLVCRVREVADELAELDDLRLLLETGRESAEVLLGFLHAVGRSNVAVNFDPANFVALGTDDPARAVSQLKGFIENVHMKDATCSEQPGLEYGRPTPLGLGDAAIPRVVSKLRATGYTGPLLIERSGGASDLETIRHAVSYLRSLLD